MSDSNFPGVIEDLCDIILSSKHRLNTDELRHIRQSGEGDLDGDDMTRLGEYQPMASTGTIRLFWKPLTNLVLGAWEQLVATELVREDDTEGFCNTCKIVIGKTYFHEQLHFMWHYAGHSKMLDRTKCKNPDTEEALATAWAWYLCHEYGRQIWADNQRAVEAIVRFCFDGITLPGYRKWKNHAHGCFFETAFAEYFALQALQCTNIDDPRDRISTFLKCVISDGALCNYEIWDHRKGTLDTSCDGSPSAFPDWDLNTVLHTKNNCYPNSSYDFQGFDHSGEDIQNHLVADYSSQSVEDVFLCHRNDLVNLNFMLKAPEGMTLKWKRLCLRKNTNPVTHILGLPKIKSLEAAFIDPLPLQKIVDAHIQEKSNDGIFDFQNALLEQGFVDQAEFILIPSQVNRI